MSRSRYSTRDKRNAPMGEPNYVRQSVTIVSFNAKRPVHVSLMPTSVGGNTYDVLDVYLSIIEATELCDKLADCLARNSDMPADF
jgi:hypothetical protein